MCPAILAGKAPDTLIPQSEPSHSHSKLQGVCWRYILPSVVTITFPLLGSLARTREVHHSFPLTLFIVQLLPLPSRPINSFPIHLKHIIKPRWMRTSLLWFNLNPRILSLTFDNMNSEFIPTISSDGYLTSAANFAPYKKSVWESLSNFGKVGSSIKTGIKFTATKPIPQQMESDGTTHTFEQEHTIAGDNTSPLRISSDGKR